MKTSLLFVVAIILTSGCQPTSSPSPNPNPIDYRETPVPTESEYCSIAEKHLLKLCDMNSKENLYCCQVVSPTKKGKSFTQFCEETQSAGVAINPKCISTINNCKEIDKCVGTVR